jgi:hypothetical protein
VKMEKQSFRIKVTNLSAAPLTFRLEPWGDEEVLLANESTFVKAEGPKVGILEIEYTENLAVIYGWEGSICEIETDVLG